MIFTLLSICAFIAFFDLFDNDDFELFRENDAPATNAQMIAVTVSQLFNSRVIRVMFQLVNSIHVRYALGLGLNLAKLSMLPVLPGSSFKNKIKLHLFVFQGKI